MYFMLYKGNPNIFHPFSPFLMMCSGYIFSFDFGASLFRNFCVDYEV